jgi:GTP-binding protein
VDTRTPLEPQSVSAAQRALALSHVALLVVDGKLGLSTQDVQLASDALEEGRPLVVALNKSDLLPDRALAKAGASAKLSQALAGSTQGVEVVAISAVTGQGLSGLLPAITRAYDRWSVRVPTGYLNRWLRRTCRTQPPPSAFKQVAIRGGSRGGRGAPIIPIPLKLKYLSQVNTRPPTFTLFANREEVPESYRRFLINSLREEFSLFGVPLRLMVRAASNPYSKGRNDSRRLFESRSAGAVKRLKSARADKKHRARNK